MRLIDADALPKYNGYALSADNVATAVEHAPTIDAVPVVRCDACKNWDLDWSSTRDPDLRYCWINDLFTDGKFFCKDGKRRTNDGK